VIAAPALETGTLKLKMAAPSAGAAETKTGAPGRLTVVVGAVGVVAVLPPALTAAPPDEPPPPQAASPRPSIAKTKANHGKPEHFSFTPLPLLKPHCPGGPLIHPLSMHSLRHQPTARLADEREAAWTA